MLGLAGETETVATGAALTVIAALAVFPSLAAVIDTLPPATALTRPVLETVATAVFAELQPTTRPVSTLLLASSVVADSCTVAPTCRVALAGDTDTEATGIGAGALTLIGAELLLPSLVAWISALPAAIALTVPVASTLATVALELPHVTTRPDKTLPTESATVAVAPAVCPTRTAAGLTATDTVATGVGAGGVTAMVA